MKKETSAKIIMNLYLVVCNVLHLAGEGDIAAHSHRVVGQCLQELGT